MAIKIGTLTPTKVMFGTREVTKICLGSRVVYEKTAPATSYEIGFRGMVGSQTSLTRTGQAVGASWSATSGVISIVGIDLTKIFGGYVGNDGEALTWDSTNLKYMDGNSVYSGNVFVKLNRFFIKPYYDQDSKLDGYDLCFAPTAPEGYEDWFLGKDHCIIGCYKARGGGFSSGLQSKQGLTYTGSCFANTIVTAYKLNSSAAYSLHEKWYNENAILQVLFMAIFATKQTTDVFPEATYRHRTNDTRPTGYMDSYRAQSLCAYEPTGDSGKRGNMFLGIEDFCGWGYELVAGVVLNNANVCPTTDYANFSYSGSYTASAITRPTDSNYITELQEDASNPGLLIPKTASGGSDTTYFCDYNYYGAGTMVWYQGACDPYAYAGVFYFLGTSDASTSSTYCAARLCGKPL